MCRSVLDKVETVGRPMIWLTKRYSWRVLVKLLS
jgi:hypothetical protein